MVTATPPSQAENADTGTTQAQSEPSAITTDVDSMSFDELDAALYSDAPAPEAAESTEAPVTDQTPQTTEEPAGETTPQVTEAAAAEPATATEEVATEAEGTAPEADRILPKRIGTGQFSETTQRALALMHSLNGGKPEGQGPYTLKACIEMVESADATGDAPATATEAEPAQPSQVDVLRDEVAALEEQILAAGEDESLFGPDLARKTIELGKKQRELAKLETKAEVQQQSQTQSVVSQREAVKEQVLREFKGANDPATILGARVATLIQEMQSPKHPEHAKLNSVDAPRYVVETAAKQVEAQLKQLGLTDAQVQAQLRTGPVAAAAITPATTPSVVPTQKPIVVASGSAGVGGTAAPQMSEAEILAAIDANPEKADEILGYGSSFRIGA